MDNQSLLSDNADINSIISGKSADLEKLKPSTRKLLTLIDEMERKAFKHREIFVKEPQKKTLENPNDETQTESGQEEKLSRENLSTDLEEFTLNDIVKLEAAIRQADSSSLLQDADTDCSIYKRLTKVCHCLNKTPYTDLIIHFHTENKYFNSTYGNIIINLRIVKQFLYMGVEHTRNALLFLNECLTTPTAVEKKEIISGCSHADICNVFDGESLIKFCIDFEPKYVAFSYSSIRTLGSQFLFKMSEIEEGKRYLNYNTKVAHDIQDILLNKSHDIDMYTVSTLRSTLKMLHPQLIELAQNYCCYPPLSRVKDTTESTTEGSTNF